MTTYAIIPAMTGSPERRQQNIIPIAGKPLIAWSIEQSLQSEHVDVTYVTTDDRQTAEVANKYGGTVLERAISTGDVTLESIVRHVLEHIDLGYHATDDLIVLLPPSAPLRMNGDIDKAIDTIRGEGADALISGSRNCDLRLWQKEASGWMGLNHDPSREFRFQDLSNQFIENGSIYIFKPESLEANKSISGGKITTYEMEAWQTSGGASFDTIGLLQDDLPSRLRRTQSNAISVSDMALLVFDFDGVLTDNKVLISQDGTEGVMANRADGLAIDAFNKIKLPMLILSTETNQVVEARARKIQVPYLHGVGDKKRALQEHCLKHKIELEHVLYLGNDFNDRAVMLTVGWPVCPSNAADEIKSIARIILSRKGGEGVVRELLDIFDFDIREID